MGHTICYCFGGFVMDISQEYNTGMGCYHTHMIHHMYCYCYIKQHTLIQQSSRDIPSTSSTLLRSVTKSDPFRGSKVTFLILHRVYKHIIVYLQHRTIIYPWMTMGDEWYGSYYPLLEITSSKDIPIWPLYQYGLLSCSHDTSHDILLSYNIT